MASQQRGDSLPQVLLVLLAVFILLPLLMMAFGMSMMGMMGWWGGRGTGVSPLWGVGMMVLFLAALLGIGYWLYRGLRSGQFGRRDRAIEVLRTAYARGDLTDEEYEQRRQRLRRDEK